VTSQSLWDTEPQAEPPAAKHAPMAPVNAAVTAPEVTEPEELGPEAAEPFDSEELEMNDPDPEEIELEEPLDPDVAFEPAPVEPVREKAPEVLALSSDEFTALEERVLRTVGLVKRERLARSDAEEREEAEMVLGQHPKWVDNRRIGQVRVPEPMTEQQSMLGAWA